MQVVDNKYVIREIRELREKVCFTIINRGKLWYDSLSTSQLNELKIWYNKWLNATETLEVPATPEWINKKLEPEEVII